ncbi:MAG: DUF3566 domain-containing protein [Aquihabitans sp.]
MSNPSGDAGPDVVKAAKPLAAGETPGRGDGGSAKAGPKRPPRPGAGARPDSAEGQSDVASPESRTDKPVKKKPVQKNPVDAKSGDGNTKAAKPGGPKPPLRRGPKPEGTSGSAPKGGSPASTRTDTTRTDTSRSRPTDATGVPTSPVPSRSASAAPITVGSGRDATAQTPRPATSPAKAPRQGRRVKRVIRRIELWSVLKLSLVLLTCLYLTVLATLVVVWGVAYSSGQIENLQKFLADVGLENYRFYGDRMFKACAAIGAVGVLAGTVLAVLTTALINLISEITGGIRVVVIEEDPPRRR